MRSFSDFPSFLKLACLSAILVLLSGCVITPPIPYVQPGAALRPGAGYVGGVFSGRGLGSFYFILYNDDTGAEFKLPFHNVKNMFDDKPEHLAVIEIPNGNYRLIGWTHEQASLGTSEVIARKIFPAKIAARFKVATGRVAFLGRFDSLQQSDSQSASYRVIPAYRMSQQSAEEWIHASYPAMQVDLVHVAGAPQ